MHSITPGIDSSTPRSTDPWFPVMPIAVRPAPGIGCARNPSFSIRSHTARTCSSVACDCITTSMMDSPEYSGVPLRNLRVYFISVFAAVVNARAHLPAHSRTYSEQRSPAVRNVDLFRFAHLAPHLAQHLCESFRSAQRVQPRVRGHRRIAEKPAFNHALQYLQRPLVLLQIGELPHKIVSALRIAELRLQ